MVPFFWFHEVMDVIDLLCKYLGKVTLFFLSISLIQFSLTRCYFHHVRLNATFCFVLVTNLRISFPECTDHIIDGS